MTELEELFREVCSFEYEAVVGDQAESYESFYKRMADKYSVTYRNTSESADNAKSEQSMTDEELVDRIKTLGLDLILSINFNGKINDNLFTDFKKDVDSLFKTHRTMPNSALNNSSKHSINQEQMMSQIEDIALDLAKSTSSIICDKLSKNVIPLDEHLTFAFKHFQQELKDCFKQHFKPSKSSNGQTLMEDNSVFQNSIKNSIRSKIGKIVNSSDDLSIIIEKLTEFHMASIEPIFRALDK